MIFKEDTHEYLNRDEKYVSMTSLLKSFKKEKDWNSIAEGYMNKHKTVDKILKDVAKKKEITFGAAKKRWGIKGDPTVEWVRSIWKDNSTDALVRGSAYHLMREVELSKQDKVIYNPIKDNVKASCDLTQLQKGYTYPELICYSHYHKVCGQADVLTITEDGFCKIVDFKTSARIDTEPKKFWNPNTKKKSAEYFRTPLSHMAVFNLNEYALQLSGYAYILEMNGFPPKDNGLIIEHILFKKNGEYDRSVDYVVPYLKEEIKAIFEYARQDFHNRE